MEAGAWGRSATGNATGPHGHGFCTQRHSAAHLVIQRGREHRAVTVLLGDGVLNGARPRGLLSDRARARAWQRSGRSLGTLVPASTRARSRAAGQIWRRAGWVTDAIRRPGEHRPARAGVGPVLAPRSHSAGGLIPARGFCHRVGMASGRQTKHARAIAMAMLTKKNRASPKHMQPGSGDEMLHSCHVALSRECFVREAAS